MHPAHLPSILKLTTDLNLTITSPVFRRAALRSAPTSWYGVCDKNDLIWVKTADTPDLVCKKCWSFRNIENTVAVGVKGVRVIALTINQLHVPLTINH